VIDTPVDLPDYLQLPFSTVATEAPVQFQDMSDYHANWSTMIQTITISNVIDNIDTMIQKELAEKEKEENKNKYYNSIWGYYNLLPEKVRECPSVRAAVLALEKRCYFLTLEQKQEVLNRVCIASLDVTEGKINRGCYVSGNGV